MENQNKEVEPYSGLQENQLSQKLNLRRRKISLKKKVMTMKISLRKGLKIVVQNEIRQSCLQNLRDIRRKRKVITIIINLGCTLIIWMIILSWISNGLARKYYLLLIVLLKLICYILRISTKPRQSKTLKILWNWIISCSYKILSNWMILQWPIGSFL